MGRESTVIVIFCWQKFCALIQDTPRKIQKPEIDSMALQSLCYLDSRFQVVVDFFSIYLAVYAEDNVEAIAECAGYLLDWLWHFQWRGEMMRMEEGSRLGISVNPDILSLKIHPWFFPLLSGHHLSIIFLPYDFQQKTPFSWSHFARLSIYICPHLLPQLALLLW